MESGPRLDLASLSRRGIVRPGRYSKPRKLPSIDGQIGGVISGGSGPNGHWVLFQDAAGDQFIRLQSQPRHYGGLQWYFICPVTGKLARVLYRPAGVGQFCSRHAWATHIAYATQFQTAIDRAHGGKARIFLRLIGDKNPEEWELPPKPKWMRWATYERATAQFDKYQDFLSQGLGVTVAKMRELAS